MMWWHNTDPDRAKQTTFGAVNQHGELVLTMEGWGMFGRRP